MKEINSFGGHLANYICIGIYQVPAPFGTRENVDTFPYTILNFKLTLMQSGQVLSYIYLAEKALF